ncbi:hypothetical protein [Oceaniglobus indicus]|uniref:hypothetical protein n=1 Tax=Oceaniglobus indicus TaxID=2047749 RepID=UPI000C1883D7|nr:hypothetical protein [Oceaniglobus indicus]
MAGKDDPGTPKSAAALREERLKAALKANLKRRKAQARARSDDAGGGKNSPQGPQDKKAD